MHDISIPGSALSPKSPSHLPRSRMRLQVGGGAVFRLDRVPSTSLGHTTRRRSNIYYCVIAVYFCGRWGWQSSILVFLITCRVANHPTRAGCSLGHGKVPGWSFRGKGPTAIFSPAVCESRPLTADSGFCGIVFSIFGFTLPRDRVRMMVCGQLRIISISFGDRTSVSSSSLFQDSNFIYLNGKHTSR